MKTIKQLLGIFIIMIAGFGIISNIVHFIGIRRTEAINLNTNGSVYKQIKEIMSDINSKKDKIKDLSFVTTDEMKAIKEYINGCYEGLNNVNISKYENAKEISDTDKYLLLDQMVATRCPAFTISALTIISKYDNNIDSIKKVFASGLYDTMISLEPIRERLLHNYEYNTTLIDLPGGMDRPEMYEISLILNSIRTQALVLQYIIDYDLNKEV
jgi:hypothetical protein